MPRIKTLSWDEAPPRLQEVYTEIVDTLGTPDVPNIFQCASLDVDICNWLRMGYKILLGRDSSIPRHLKEKIVLVVSTNTACQYCVDVHTSMVQSMGFDPSTIDDLSREHQSATLSDKENAALKLAVKISNEAYKVTEKDHEELRERHGYTDQQILEIVAIGSAFDFVNRFVSALSD